MNEMLQSRPDEIIDDDELSQFQEMSCADAYSEMIPRSAWNKL